MSRSGLVRAGLAALLTVLALGLTPAFAPQRAAADSGETVATELRPGWNLAGWTSDETGVATIFDEIPALETVYAWDADDQWFRWAVRDASGLHGDLETLTAGMGLWLELDGGEPFTWTRPFTLQAGLADLRPGWNLVAWGGRDGIATAGAVAELDGILIETWTNGRGWLRKGDALWLEVSRDKPWWQPHPPPRFEFIGEFTTTRRQWFRDEVDQVVAFFVRRFGVAVPGLTVRIEDRTDLCGGYAAKTVFLSPDCSRAFPHEYAHAVQEYLATLQPNGSWGHVNLELGPAWLSEGIANYAAAVYNDMTGFYAFDRYLQDVARAVLQTENLLQDIEKDMFIGDAGPNYSLGSLATEWIIDHANEEALFQFYSARIPSERWSVTFGQVFRVTISNFYESFEVYRIDATAPPPLIRGTVSGDGGEPIEGVSIVAYANWLGGEQVISAPKSDSEGVFAIPNSLRATAAPIGKMRFRMVRRIPRGSPR